MQGRLNIFQKGMLQWNEMHPYGAVHVARIRGALEATRLRACINATVEAGGLTHLTVDARRGTFQYESGSADCDLEILGGVEGPAGALTAELVRQLNLPFAGAGRFKPFRFLAAPAGNSFFLGLAYFHPAADAESIVLLLRDIVRTYLGEGTPGSSATLDLYPDHRAHLLRRHLGVVARRLVGLPALVRNIQQSHRAIDQASADTTNGFVWFPVGPEDLRSVVAAAESWEVTVNDMLMALLLKALSPLAAARREARRRRKISVGCIVNLRKDLGLDNRRTFGLFLGSFTVTHEVPDGIGLRELVRDIRQQTASVKRHKLYLGTPLELSVARFALRFFPRARRKGIYAKYYPLWAGITNLNLNALWEPENGSAPLDYFRAVSTGPITPLVLSVTTLGNRASIGLSYRTCVASPKDIEGFQRRFLECLEETRRGA